LCFQPTKSPSISPSSSPSTSPTSSPTLSPSKPPTVSPTNNPNPSLRCLSGEECKCPKGYYCTANSDEPKECSPFSRCDKVGCTNSKCEDIPTGPRKKKSILKRLVDIATKNRSFEPDELEFSATVSLNLYRDVSSFLCCFLVNSININLHSSLLFQIGEAAFNGGYGFEVSVGLPFSFLPSVTLIFGGQPLHCLSNGGGYTFAGIGLDLISVSGIYEPQNEKGFFAQMKDGYKERKEKVFSCLKEKKACLTKKDFGLSELSVGVGYSYDYSPNSVSRELLSLDIFLFIFNVQINLHSFLDRCLDASNGVVLVRSAPTVATVQR